MRMHFGARQQQAEECPRPSVALQSFYALFLLLPGPALWDPVVGALPRGRARCASGGPALAAALTPAGVRRGASGASSWCARRWGRAVQGWRPLWAAGDGPRAAQGGTARFLFRHAAARRTSGSNVCSTYQASSHGVMQRAAVEGHRGAQPWSLTIPSLRLDSRASARCRTAARTVRICAFLCGFIRSHYFPAFFTANSAIDLAIVLFSGHDGQTSTKK